MTFNETFSHALTHPSSLPLCEQETQFTTLVNAAVSLSTPPAIYLI